MSDARVDKFARILVDYSARIKPGDRVLIEATTAAEPLVRALYSRIIEVGGHPVPLLELPDQEGTTVMGAYSPDGRYIATVSGSGIVRVWDAKSGQPVSPEVNLGGESYDLH